MDATDSSLFVNLMLADLIQAIAIYPNVKWMLNGEITTGSLCTAQAALKQIGIVGVSLSSLMIAIHTFVVLVLRWRVSRLASALMVAAIWVCMAIIIGVPNIVHRNQSYYGKAGYWCWIRDDFPTERIVAEYLWVWTAGLSMILLYGAMFLVVRKWFIIENGIHWHKTYNQPEGTVKPTVPKGDGHSMEEDRKTRVIANSLLYYPLVYIICVIPNSACRWAAFQGASVPYQLTLAANSIYNLSGTLNLVLFLVTRPQLVVGPAKNTTEAEAPRVTVRRSSHGHLADVTYSSTTSPDLEKYSPQPFEHRVLADNDVVMTPISQHASLNASGSRHGKHYLSVEQHNQKRSYGSVTDDEDQGYLAG
ncbi:hypothetical protein CVT24_003416 [Panaeolus cyanescens]|uniref:Uncharacterized protein n=1 Tax=Panaeolus cyanescens TaxID=181874 RepID=A0A409Y6Y1_9AGAR|nr:hypothetical protein CVT24_003416 [Panaeolus cyanescens]